MECADFGLTDGCYYVFLCKQYNASEQRTNVVLVGVIHLALYSFIFEQT